MVCGCLRATTIEAMALTAVRVIIMIQFQIIILCIASYICRPLRWTWNDFSYSYMWSCICSVWNILKSDLVVAVFYDWIWEKSPSSTQQQGIFFTIKQKLYTSANNSDRYWCWKFYRLLLQWLVSEACQTSTSAWVVFKSLHNLIALEILATLLHSQQSSIQTMYTSSVILHLSLCQTQCL